MNMIYYIICDYLFVLFLLKKVHMIYRKFHLLLKKKIYFSYCELNNNKLMRRF